METLVTRFTPTTSKADAEAIVRRWIDSALWRQEAHLAETDGIAYFDPKEIEKLGREEAAELDALLQRRSPPCRRPEGGHRPGARPDRTGS
jgi:hypothetical protein